MSAALVACRVARVVAPVGIIAAVLVLQAPQARAEGAPAPRKAEEIARQHFARGQHLYLGEQYPEALIEFEAGYAALPLPGFLVNIGQCRRRLGDITAARESYEKFLRLAPDSPLAAEVRSLVQELALTPPPLEVARLVSLPAAEAAARPTPTSKPAPAPLADETRAVSALAPEPVAIEPTPTPLSAPAPAPASLGADRAALPLEIVRPVFRPVFRPVPPPRPRAVAARRTWWIWGVAGVVAVAVSTFAIVAGSGDTTTTVHDGTLGTLRR